MDWSELGGFLIGFGIYAFVFILSLILVGLIKDLRSRAFVSASICFGLMATPTSFFMMLGLAMTAHPGIKEAAFLLAVFAVQAGVAALYGLSIYRRNKKLIALACLVVMGTVFGSTYIMFFQNFDWRIGITNPGVIWDNVIGTSNDDSAECVIETPNGEFIVAANTWSTKTRSDVLLVKMDESGKKIWEKTYGGGDNDSVHRILSTPDGYIMVGETRSYGAGGEDVWLVKLDIAGNVQWQKTFGGPHNDAGANVQLIPDSGFIIAGKTWTPGNERLDAWLIKTDAAGREEWSNTYQADNGRWSNAKDVIVTSDGGYVLVGDVWSPDPRFAIQHTTIWAKKLDSRGNEVWRREFFSAKGNTGVIGVQQTVDGSYIVAGNAPADYVPNHTVLWLIKITPQGDEEWNKKWGEPKTNHFDSITLTKEGNILATGYHSDDYAGEQDFVLVEADPHGKEVRSKTLNKLYVDRGKFSRQTTDGNYITIGNIAHDFDQVDIWIAKFSAEELILPQTTD